MSFWQKLSLKFGNWRLCFLGLLLVSLVAGCGSSHHDGNAASSSGGQASRYTKVIFHFEGYDKEVSQGRIMPQNTKEVRFSGFNGSGLVVYGPQKYAAAEIITLTDVPLTTCDFLVEYLSSDEQVLGLIHKSASLSDKSTTTVNVGDFSSLAETVSSLQISPSSATAIKGYGQQFVASVLLRDGFAANVNAECLWSSSNSEIATFKDSACGYAWALTAGSCEVTAQYASFAATALLNVSEAKASTFELIPVSDTMGLGEEQQLTLNCVFSDGTRSDITKQATWQSSHPQVATVSSTGLVEAIASGSTVITATDTVSGQSAQCTIVVSMAKLAKVTLQILKDSTYVTESSLETFWKARFTLRAQGLFDDNTSRDVTGFVNWEISQPEAIQPLDTAGLFLASELAQEDVHIKIASINVQLPQIEQLLYENNDIAVSISQAQLQSVTLSCQGSWAAPAGGFQRQLIATGHFNDGTTQDITDSVTWKSKKQTGLIISATGLLTTGSPSTLPVTDQVYAVATVAEQSVTSEDYTFTTTGATVESFNIYYGDQKSDDLELAKGLTKQFSAQATLSDGTSEDLTNLATWTTSNAEVLAKVTTKGLNGQFRAVSQGGPAQVSASYLTGGTTIDGDNQINVSVTAPQVVAISLSPSQAVIKLEKTQQFTVNIVYSDGSTAPVTKADSWTCEPSGKASLNDEGLATALEETGLESPAVITASYTFEEQTFTAQAQLFITDPNKFTVTNAYFKNVTGAITAQVVAIDGDGSTYDPTAVVIPASEPSGDKIDFAVYTSLKESSDKIKSVHLYNTLGDGTTKCAFEWWDEDAGQSIEENPVLDIASNTFAGGTGTGQDSDWIPIDPYLVANPRQLNNVRDYSHKEGYSYTFFKQTQDINFENSCGLEATLEEEGTIAFTTINDGARYYNGGEGWVAIGGFLAFDGQEHTIDQLLVNSTTADRYELQASLFGDVSGKIKDVIVGPHSFISGTSEDHSVLVTSICCPPYGYVMLEGCINNASVAATSISQATYAGGVASFAYDCDILKCTNNGSVTAISDNGSTHAGGIVCDSGMGISTNNNTNNGRVRAKSTSGEVEAAGIVPYNSNAKYCANSGIVIATSDTSTAKASGISKGNVDNCTNSGEVTATSSTGNAYASGISKSENEGTGSANYCYNSGDITANSTGSAACAYASGIGDVNSNNCCDLGAIEALCSKGTAYAVGICCAYQFGSSANATNCYSAGTVSGQATTLYLGGICAGEYSSATNTFYLKDQGAERGISGQEDVKGKTWAITLDQLTNKVKVPISASETEDVLLWQALNASQDNVWQLNEESQKYVPLGYPILTWLLPTP